MIGPAPSALESTLEITLPSGAPLSLVVIPPVPMHNRGPLTFLMGSRGERPMKNRDSGW